MVFNVLDVMHRKSVTHQQIQHMAEDIQLIQTKIYLEDSPLWCYG